VEATVWSKTIFNNQSISKAIVLLVIVFFGFIGLAKAQTTEFTYQGRLLDSSLPPTANYDFGFSLWDSLANGTQQGTTQTITGVAVTNGIFTVRLNFGDQFTGAARFIQIEVRPAGGGAYTTLAPRQSITSGPYAIRSLNSTTADTATNSLQLGGVAADQYVVTTDPRMTDDRNPLPGSANYIQNQNAAPQSSSNFNVSGTGTADILNATTQYNIGGNRLLGVAGIDKVFAGVGAGSANTTGNGNSFFGPSTGFANTTDSFNTFFGTFAGDSNTTGAENSFFGHDAGQSNTTGLENSFFGRAAGYSNTTGNFNSFFGRAAGVFNTTGNSNSFFGRDAGYSNTTGDANSFFGHDAGFLNTTGAENSFFGRDAGYSNTTGDANSFFGHDAGFSNTTGYFNSFFGQGAGFANTTGLFNSFFGDIAGYSNTTGTDNAFFGRFAGYDNTTGFNNSFFGSQAGSSNTTGSVNSFFGSSAGISNTTGTYNTTIGFRADVRTGNLLRATAIGAGAVVIASNQIQLGREALDTVRIGKFNAGGPTHVCVNSYVLTFCSSSLRYKENVQTLGSGLNLIERLRPVTFDWKDRKEADLGLIAEEVAEVEPLLVTRNDKGVIEGVKYDQIGAVLINAVKEQQAEISGQQSAISNQQSALSDQQRQIEQQQKQISEQKEINKQMQSRIDELTKIVCTMKPDSLVCKQEEK
jgi:hypothetical protein